MGVIRVCHPRHLVEPPLTICVVDGGYCLTLRKVVYDAFVGVFFSFCACVKVHTYFWFLGNSAVCKLVFNLFRSITATACRFRHSWGICWYYVCKATVVAGESTIFLCNVSDTSQLSHLGTHPHVWHSIMGKSASVLKQNNLLATF